MAATFTCSRSLRVLGQTLEKMGVDSFEIRTNDDNFYLQCGDPAPPHLAIIDFSYSSADIRSFDSEARTKRQESFKFVDFNGLGVCAAEAIALSRASLMTATAEQDFTSGSPALCSARCNQHKNGVAHACDTPKPVDL